MAAVGIHGGGEWFEIEVIVGVATSSIE